MDRNIIITLSKKIVRVVIAAKLAGLCLKVGKAVYDSVPKFDTIEGIDTDLLIKENTTDLSAIDLNTPDELPEIV
mgnify:CR=1 FL=1